MTAALTALSGRDRAILRAVADGRVDIALSSEPDLFVDGLFCCDQLAAHALAHAGFICPATTGRRGSHVPALLTTAGVAALADTTGGTR